MTAVVITLDTNGYLTDVAQKADCLFSDFLVSDYSQSNFHVGQVKSLPYLIQAHTKDLVFLRNEVQRALYDLYDPFFESVDVRVSIEEPDPVMKQSEARVDIRINLIVRVDGRTYSLGRLINVANSRISRIVDLNRI